jgi:hypothetical protein
VALLGRKDPPGLVVLGRKALQALGLRDRRVLLAAMGQLAVMA